MAVKPDRRYQKLLKSIGGKKILVTGGAGFIGSNLVHELNSQKAEVIVLDDMLTGSSDNLKGLGVQIIKAGVEDESAVSKVGKVDFIFHLAAITDTTVTNEKRMMNVNALSFKNLVRLAEENRAPVVYASSAAVYGMKRSRMLESSMPAPANAYARSKVALEEIAHVESNRTQIPMIGLRFFNVYGPREIHKKSVASMIYQIYAQMAAGKQPRLFRWGHQKRDFVYVKDVVRGIILASAAKQAGVYNIGTGKAASFNQIVESVNHTLGTQLQPDYFDNPFTEFYQNFTEADITFAKRALGFKPLYELRSGIRDYHSFLTSNSKAKRK